MTTIASLTEKILAFRDERDWLQFHNPKDMAAAIAIEAAELQELFLWKNHEEQLHSRVECGLSNRQPSLEERSELFRSLIPVGQNHS